MNVFLNIIVLVVFLFYFAQCKLAPDILISNSDKERFKSYFDLNQEVSFQNLPNLYYSLVGLNILYNENLNSAFSDSIKKTDLCQNLNTFLTEKNNLDLTNLFYITSLLKIIKCQISTNINSFFEYQLTPNITVVNLYKYGYILDNIGKKVDSIKISKLLSNSLKNDDSLLSLGYSLQLASLFTGNELNQYLNKIPNIVSYADEINRRILQYEGGLFVTATIFNGILKLSSASNKPTGLTNEQLIKFTNYFLNRLTVTNLKGAAELLMILKELSYNKFHVPIVVKNYGINSINTENQILTLKITNVLGKSLNEDLSVSIESENLKKEVLNQVQGDSTLFSINLFNKKLKAGKHTFKIFVESKKLRKHILIINDIELDIYIQTKVILNNIEFAVMDKNQMSTNYEKIDSLKDSKKLYKVSNINKLSLRFTIKNLISLENISAQQVYVFFLNKKYSKEVIFVADQDKFSKLYKFDINLAFKGREFDFISGLYNFNILIGDPIISNPSQIHLFDFNIDFSNSVIKLEDKTYQPKPEISHIFKQPEKRPPFLVSQTFTILCLLPLPFLFTSWYKLGINFSNFSFSITLLVFHTSLALIFIFYTLFFIKLNMFTLIKFLSGVGISTFISGHYLFKNLANKKTDNLY